MLTAWIRQGIRKTITASTRLGCRWFPPQVPLAVRKEINLVLPLDYRARQILLHVDSSTEFETRLESCAKEPGTVSWLERSLRSGDVLFDIGANVGAYSLIAATHNGGAVRVCAFEPSFANYAQLCRNITLNRCDDRVIAFPVALSDRTAIDVFCYHDLTPGAALHALGQSIDQSGEQFAPVARQSVMSYRLDDLIDRFTLTPPTHLKIDVDGIELSILQGAERTLAQPSLRTALIEVNHHDGHADAIIETMKRHGFSIADRHPVRDASGNESAASNCIFVKG